MPTVIDTTRVAGVRSLYTVAFATVVASGLFSLMFFAILVWNYFASYTPNLTNDPAATTSMDDPNLAQFLVLPTDQKQFMELKAKARLDPGNEDLKTKIRELDQRLRYEFFHKREQNRYIAFSLLISVIVLLVSAKTTTTLKRKLPHSKQDACDCKNRLSENQQLTFAILGLGLVACFAIGIVFGFSISGKSEIGTFLLTHVPEELLTESSPKPNPAEPENQVTTPAAVNPATINPAEDRIAFLAAYEKQWPGFRGPGGSATSINENIPTQWNATTGEGILWKTEVALPGNSSPVVWENRVFLTGANEQSRKIYCYDTETGNMVWEVEAPATPESLVVPSVNEDTGFASPTPTTDGARVYAIFANGDIAAVDFQGKVVWSKSLGVPESAYGYAASLAIWFDRVIVQFDVGDGKDGQSRIMALNSSTGEIIWETPREIRSSWPSPIVRKIGDRWQIITSAEPFAIAYRPEDGKEIWRCKCLSGDVGPTPTVFGNIVYIVNEYPQFSAIDATQTGEVQVLWSATDSLPDTPSPLATEKFVYTLASYGYLTAYNVADQIMAWELEVGEGASFYSSPSMAAGKIYCFDDSEDSMNAFLIEPGETEGTILAINPMGEPVVTSPAFADGRIYIRGKKHLFCIGLR